MLGVKVKTIFIVVSFLGIMAVTHAGGNEWLTDFKEAQKRAQKENKLILADFSGTEWCVWCKNLDSEVFSKKKFLDFAKKHFILLLVDFPVENVKKQNIELAQKYKVKGFPTVLVLDSNGKVVVATGYQPGGPENYIKFLKEKALKKK
jgi:protein disulfide-isomerase